jgi:hypothetical protein
VDFTAHRQVLKNPRCQTTRLNLHAGRSKRFAAGDDKISGGVAHRHLVHLVIAAKLRALAARHSTKVDDRSGNRLAVGIHHAVLKPAIR